MQDSSRALAATSKMGGSRLQSVKNSKKINKNSENFRCADGEGLLAQLITGQILRVSAAAPDRKTGANPRCCASFG